MILTEGPTRAEDPWRARRAVLSAESRPLRTHLAAYLATAIALGVLTLLVVQAERTTTPQLHTILEVMATTFAFVIGVIALLRYRTRSDLPYLFLGVGFLGASLLDGFHAWATSVYAVDLFPSALPDLHAVTWGASRIFLGGMLLATGWIWWWQSRRPERPALGPARIGIGVALLILLVVLIAFLVPLPSFYDARWTVARPLDLGAALFFGVALAGFLAVGEWRKEPAGHWLVLSIIVGLAIQLLVMPFSTMAGDTRFDMAHVLKISSYGLVLVGLFINIHTLHQVLVRDQHRLGEANRLLEAEIGRRSAAEAQTENRKRLLESIFRNMSDGVAVADASGRVTQFNRAAEEITGMSLDEVHTASWPDGAAVYRPDGKTPLPPEDLPLARALRGEATDDTMVFLRSERRPEGIHLSVSGRPLRDPAGTVTGGVIVFRDITTERTIQEQMQRYAEALEQRNLDLQDFATIVSHDLKEPLRKVLAFGERLEGRLVPGAEPKALDYLRRMRQSADRMRILIDDLLAYTRLQELHVERSVDLVDVAERAVQDLEQRIDELGATVEVQDLPRLDCDPLKMYQVFVNLIGNGLKYHRPDVAPRVSVSGRTEGQTCVVTVEDNGIGIEMKYSDRIFRPFHRLHTRSQYEGSGIGLAIVRKIVDHHQGTVEVESEPGQGSRFVLRFPIRQTRLEVAQIAE